MLQLHKFVYYIVGILQSLIVFRFVLKILGATPSNEIVNFIYDITQPFVAPFIGIIPPYTNGNLTIEWSIVFALMFYSFVGFVVGEFFKILSPGRNRD